MFNLNVWASNPLERKNWIRGTFKKKEKKKEENYQSPSVYNNNNNNNNNKHATI